MQSSPQQYNSSHKQKESNWFRGRLAFHLGNKSPVITRGRLLGEAVGIIYNLPTDDGS